MVMEDITESTATGTMDETNASEDAAAATAASETNSLMDGTPRASRRRAVLMRTPSGAASSQIAAGWTSRKRFKCVPTESLSPQIWPNVYLPNDQVKAGDEVGREAAFKAEQTFVRLTTAAFTPEEAQAIHEYWKKNRLLKPGGPTVLPPRVDDICQMPGSELVGFMARRGDFDIEWENDAEQAVADMEFLPGEPEEDRKLKLQVLQIYNSKLDEREKRKQFILSRKLWDYSKAHQQEKKMPQDERDLVHRMRLFERFHTPAEHEKFLADILKAKRLRKEIAKLQMYRRMGIRSMADAERYELDKQRRLTHRHFQLKEESKKDDSGDTASTSGRPAGLTEETTSTSLWKQYRTGERRNRKSINRGKPGAASTSVAAGGTPEKTENETTRDEKPSSGKEETKSEAGIPTNKKESSISTLSSTEQELCEKLDLTEDQYKEIKRSLISQSLAQGLLDKESIGSQKRAMVKMDAERRGQVIDFMLRAGWVSAKAAPALRQSSSNVAN